MSCETTSNKQPISGKEVCVCMQASMYEGQIRNSKSIQIHLTQNFLHIEFIIVPHTQKEVSTMYFGFSVCSP